MCDDDYTYDDDFEPTLPAQAAAEAEIATPMVTTKKRTRTGPKHKTNMSSTKPTRKGSRRAKK